MKVNLYTSNTQSGDFTLELWSSNGLSGTGALPNIKLATLYTGDWSNLVLNTPTAVTEVSLFTENYFLVSGTTYWLVVKQPGNGSSAKRWSRAVSGAGKTASFNSNTNNWSNGSTANLGAQISVVP